MNQIKVFDFEKISSADLVVDAIYKGGSKNPLQCESINSLLGTGNQGGFRHRGSIAPSNLNLIALVSNAEEPEWPDSLDVETGQYIYYGDNRAPGRDIHDTNKKGNIILRDIFNFTHEKARQKVPPIFVFTKLGTSSDVVFRGLAAPGGEGISSVEDLVAIWKSLPGGRFQNYKAIFTILDIPYVSRAWIDAVKTNRSSDQDCPEAWRKWVSDGVYTPLKAQRTRKYRTRQEQLPTTDQDRRLLKEIHDCFKGNPYAFERCAAELAQMMDRNIVEYELTRRSRDGGRDAFGKYRIGTKDNFIHVDFSLEAKCKLPTSAVGVKESSRLISRLRHRQFGILVTTSFLDSQAYKEIVADKHPVVVMSGADIVSVLKNTGHGTTEAVKNWLEKFTL